MNSRFIERVNFDGNFCNVIKNIAEFTTIFSFLGSDKIQLSQSPSPAISFAGLQDDIFWSSNNGYLYWIKKMKENVQPYPKRLKIGNLLNNNYIEKN